MAERGRKIDSSLKEELKREIKEELLVELRGKPIVLDYNDDEDYKEAKEDKKEKIKTNKNGGRKYIKLLIGLILIVLILDFAVVFFYYVPINFSSIGSVIKNEPAVLEGYCSDGTLEGNCSKTKPYYCIEGELVEAGYTCGCPEGYIRDFQSCKISS